MLTRIENICWCVKCDRNVLPVSRWPTVADMGRRLWVKYVFKKGGKEQRVTLAENKPL